MARYLLIAHQTASSKALRRHVASIADEDPEAEFVLIVPATPVEHLVGWTEREAKQAATDAGERARMAFAEDGVHITELRVGDASPLYAIQDAFIDDDFDQVIVSTHPGGISRWLGMDLISRARKAITVPLVHVESES